MHAGHTHMNHDLLTLVINKQMPLSPDTEGDLFIWKHLYFGSAHVGDISKADALAHLSSQSSRLANGDIWYLRSTF